MRFSDFRLDPNGKTCFGSFVRMLWTKGLVWEGCTVLDYPLISTEGASAGLFGCWALMLGGNDGRVSDNVIAGGAELHDDGIHWAHGTGVRIHGNDVHSGDDAIAIGGEPTASLVAQPDHIQHVTIGPNRLHSERAFALKIYVPSGFDGSVKHVSAKGLVGRSGVLRNGWLGILDQANGLVGTARIRHIDIEGLGDVGGPVHDGVNPFILWAQSVRDLKVRGSVTVTQPATPVAPFSLYYVYDCENVDADIKAVML
jgi:hypothetical protein